jgi:hypothetical protein
MVEKEAVLVYYGSGTGKPIRSFSFRPVRVDLDITNRDYRQEVQEVSSSCLLITPERTGNPVFG